MAEKFIDSLQPGQRIINSSDLATLEPSEFYRGGYLDGCSWCEVWRNKETSRDELGRRKTEPLA